MQVRAAFEELNSQSVTRVSHEEVLCRKSRASISTFTNIIFVTLLYNILNSIC